MFIVLYILFFSLVFSAFVESKLYIRLQCPSAVSSRGSMYLVNKTVVDSEGNYNFCLVSQVQLLQV